MFRKMYEKHYTNASRKKKRILVSLACLACIYGVFFYQIPLPYQGDRIRASDNFNADSVIDIFFDGFYSGVSVRQEGDALFIGFRGTLFTRLISPAYRRLVDRPNNRAFAQEPMHFAIGSGIAVDYGRQGRAIPLDEAINRVYYMNFRAMRRGATSRDILMFARA